jgi:biotin-(acetyl-CoA carboxylase) ligase
MLINSLPKQVFNLNKTSRKLLELNQDLHGLGIQHADPEFAQLQSIISNQILSIIEQVSNQIYQQYHSSIYPIENILTRQTSVADKRKQSVETNKFITAFGILLAQQTGLSLTDSVNYELNKYYQKPLSKKMVANYVRLIRLDATTVDGQYSLIRLLGPLFPIHLLN